MKVAIIGAGRLGSSLNHMLKIKTVLVDKNTPIPTADIYWLTVRDSQITSAARHIPRGAIVLHSSGALGLEALPDHSQRAVLHPMMTFSGPQSLPQGAIPATYECTPGLEKTILWLAEQAGFQACSISGDRALYHAASVFAGNYASWLLEIGAVLLKQYDIPPSVGKKMLLPLALKSLQNASSGSLSKILTGPIARGDENTIDKHKTALADLSPELAQLYDQICLDIRRRLELNHDICDNE